VYKKETYHQQHEEEFTLKEKLQYSFMGLIVLGGSFYLGRKLIRNVKSTNEEKKTYEDGSSATYAKQLKMAFENDMWFGWGTDEEAIRTVMRKIPSKEVFRQVITSYERLYARSLMEDMKDELTTTEYNEMLAILAAKPDNIRGGYKPVIGAIQYQSWAKRLKAAFDVTYGWFPGTDEDAVKAVFMEIPTQTDFNKVIAAYKIEYSRDLMSDIKSELEIWEYASMMKIIVEKPKV
jgi:hypothetical protein